jgi:2-amino-4-hydroxy-6-hydroxymethyldihydropteridine diphosphokinase
MLPQLLGATVQISMLATMTPVYIALGSNLGQRKAVLDAALIMIESLPNTFLISASQFRETAPVDAPPSSPPFLNAVALFNTKLGPDELMTHLLTIEQELGRRRDGTRNAPRTIDLDLLLYGNEKLLTERLIVPHPRMIERRFVLEPLAALAPDLVHPENGKTIRQLLAELDAGAAR